MTDAEVLARFNFNEAFRKAADRWPAEDKVAFCAIARTVHEAGLDWYFLNTTEGYWLRFGIRNRGRTDAEGVIGTLRPQSRLLELTARYGVTTRLHARFSEIDVGHLRDGLAEAQAEIASWERIEQGHLAFWPGDYSEATGGNDMSTNLILYGPPGTGKTYATAREAVRLCGEDASEARFPENSEGRKELMEVYNRLRKEERIGFVTFHQSYSYEDFVEGLRPISIANEGGLSAGFELKPHDGILKIMAGRAAKRRKGPGNFDLGNRRVFKMSLGFIGDPANSYVFEDAIDKGHIRLGYDPIDFSNASFAEEIAIIAACNQFDQEHPGRNAQAPTGQSGRVQCPNIFRNRMRRGDVVIVPKGNSHFRAVGVIEGDYQYDPTTPDYVHKRQVKWLWHDADGQPVAEIYGKNLTTQSVYELRGDLLKKEALTRLIDSQAASEDAPLLPHVLIIDEINRGNVSKIFGELITLIEPDKRLGKDNGLKVTLPYSGHEFGVPANLHIIGTMNTADRSIALLDTALRRRFTFKEMEPKPGLLKVVGGINLAAVLTTLNERIEYLLDRDHRIGHAYFMNCKDRDGVDAVMRDKVIPLLQEYFFDDWDRLAAVLGESERGGNFLAKTTLKDPTGKEGKERVRWSVLESFKNSDYSRLTGPATAAAEPASGEEEENA